jgi:hypothetical protein
MEKLRTSLAMTPEQQRAFRKDERDRERYASSDYSRPAGQSRLAKAQERRERRAKRRLERV